VIGKPDLFVEVGRTSGRRRKENSMLAYVTACGWRRMTAFTMALVAGVVVASSMAQASTARGARPVVKRSGQTLTYYISGTQIGIRFRNSPHWNDVGGSGGYDGDWASLVCGTWGDPVGPYANRRWHLVQTRFGQGYLPDRFLTTPNVANQPTPGESECGAPQPPSPPPLATGGATAAENGAVNWARAKVGANVYSYLCLAFVFDAYSAVGINLRPWVTVPINSNTYARRHLGALQPRQHGRGYAALRRPRLFRREER
jgi:hypothetical protein